MPNDRKTTFYRQPIFLLLPIDYPINWHKQVSGEIVKYYTILTSTCVGWQYLIGIIIFFCSFFNARFHEKSLIRFTSIEINQKRTVCTCPILSRICMYCRFTLLMQSDWNLFSRKLVLFYFMIDFLLMQFTVIN